MSSEEFALHYEMEALEPLEPGPAAGLAAIVCGLANGPLVPPGGRANWRMSDFIASPWVEREPEKQQAPAHLAELFQVEP